MDTLSPLTHRAGLPSVPDAEPIHADTTKRLHHRFRLMLVHESFHNPDREIGDLRNCGLPINTEVLLVSVAKLFRSPLYLVPGERRAGAPQGPAEHDNHASFTHASESLHELQSATRQARAKLQAAFPTWEINTIASARSYQVVIDEALRWQPQLIVLSGAQSSPAHKRALRRLLRKLATEARLSVRVVRAENQLWPMRRPVLVAVDGAASAQAVVSALRDRRVARGSEVRLLYCTEPLRGGIVDTQAGYAGAGNDRIAGLLLQTKADIESLGYKVGSLLPIGNSAQAILHEAQRTDAECILIGKGHNDVLGELIAQSVAATVVANAKCSVEILCSKLELRKAQLPAFAA